MYNYRHEDVKILKNYKHGSWIWVYWFRIKVTAMK